MRKKYTGTLTAIVTPFLENCEVDVEALRSHVQFQIKNGVHGLVPCGSTGEGGMLNSQEYILVVQTAVEEAAGKIPVIAGASAESTMGAIEHSKHAKEAGADAVLHATPYYRPNLKGLIAHYKAIADAVDMPIILYNIPGRTGINFTAEMSLEIARKVDHVVGIKEASGNINQIIDIINGAPEHFSVLAGDDSITYPVMALGGQGVICTVSNEIPKEFSTLTEAALDGNLEKAKKIHYEWLDLMRVNFIEPNPQPVKTALALMGRIKEVFRLPMVPMDSKNKEALKAVLKKHRLI